MLPLVGGHVTKEHPALKGLGMTKLQLHGVDVR